jgi:hypothetical protein
LQLRDVNGDGEPEVVLELSGGGFFCCSWWRVYGWDALRRTYVVTHFWDSSLPTVAELKGGRAYFGQDRRFHDVFGPGTAPNPLQIWVFRRGGFRDVTRRYPRLLERGATLYWRQFLSLRVSAIGDQTYAAGVFLPMWAAYEYLLGRAGTVKPTLERQLRQDQLERKNDGLTRGFITDLTSFLRDLGYARS